MALRGRASPSVAWPSEAVRPPRSMALRGRASPLGLRRIYASGAQTPSYHPSNDPPIPPVTRPSEAVLPNPNAP
jgi:hypothetical protein